MPDVCSIYSVNEGNTVFFRQKDKDFIEFLKHQPKSTGRYIGSLVADFHRNLIKGGIYLYPAVAKDGGDYQGKLRLNFEAKPLAFLVEQAAGLASDGKNNILDIEPESLHQRVPLFIGNKEIVEKYLTNYKLS